MRKRRYKIVIIIIVGLIGVQFIRPNKLENEQVNKYDIIYANNPSKEVVTLLQSTCYDCHSNQTREYWYSNIAPVAWLVDKDIKNGRQHLNFSDWEKYSYDQKVDYAGAIMLQMYDGKMPLKEYIWMHPEAKLAKKDQNKITEWINSLVE
ncbi:heme-binding domain-containing protein [Psychroserpens sp.]|uniref:heme-binding domain-containing protein n=1 Tax=Psychroserpens sp. TaxID=2020870 RepID=UPI001B1A8AB5|nr:heme-binding domain-containing protein [Psychroserpens sp.]MBO6630236.1 heme-binding domain-containing protein [Psychroserpens sp.]MBO6652831.1 heme-binding domain-containing protein [Psychroserpens sp.]MBO6681397.1 heme-binding domain-containing protein [Psychroserpens sp.]MBO6749172.1 heme-binding domain-containing protein [Psychroserpens sp.]MBO6914382.1 heme-binding domain-containing protein [Psychroserpens sp.]